MATPEQHDIFRAYILLMAEPGLPDDPSQVITELAFAAREGEAARVAREIAVR